MNYDKTFYLFLLERDGDVNIIQLIKVNNNNNYELKEVSSYTFGVTSHKYCINK